MNVNKEFCIRTLGGLLLTVIFFIGLAPPVAAQSSDDQFAMPYPSYFIAGDCHPDLWPAWCALDLNSIPDSGPIYSPINGTVVGKGNDDGYTNTYIIIENTRWKIFMLHCDFSLVENGQTVTLGQQLGWEAKIGRSSGPHVHLSVYDKVNGWIDPRNAVTSSVTGEVSVLSPGGDPLSDPNAGGGYSMDSSINPQPPGEVNWNITVVADQGMPSGQTTQTDETTVQQTVVLQQQNPFRSFLATIKREVWGVIFVLLIFLIMNKNSRPWWPVWVLLIGLLTYGFFWSSGAISVTVEVGESVQTTQTATQESFEAPPDPEDEIVFPAIPEPVANAIVLAPPTNVSTAVIQLSYEPRILKFSTRPPLLSGLDPATQAWFEWLQAGNLQYETLWFWHDCKLVGILPESCSRSQFYTAAPPYEAVVAALSVHQLGGAPIWDSLTQKLQETGNSGPPFATSSALAMGPLQEKQWFFSNFGAYSGGNVQDYFDAMLAHSNWAVSQGVLAHNTDQATYASRYAGSPCNPPDSARCQYSGKFNSLMWNNYSGMGDSSYFLSRLLMDSWIAFQEQSQEQQ